MTQPNFSSRINWRQILIHFIGMWFFMCACHLLVYLCDMNLVEIVRRSKVGDVSTNLESNGKTIDDLLNFSIWIDLSGFGGLIIGFLLSLIISLKKGWLWFNSVITFALAFALYKFGDLGSVYVTNFLLNTTSFMKNMFLEFAIWGGIFLVMGIFIFFSKKLRNFISNEVPAAS